MAKVLQVNGTKVKVITDEGKVVSVSAASVNYLNPKAGDRVIVYQSGDKYVITKATDTTEITKAAETTDAVGVAKIVDTIEKDVTNATRTMETTSYFIQPNPDESKSINKHLFVWVGTFIFGSFGLDRFMRGQIGIGICKLFFGWTTFSLWWLIDWLIAVNKAYGHTYGSVENITFSKNGRYLK